MAGAGGRKDGYSVEDKFLMACEMEEKLMAVLDTYTIPYRADSECMGSAVNGIGKVNPRGIILPSDLQR